MTRIYRVQDEDKEHLVEAATPAQAVRHVASRIKAEVAMQRDLARLCGAGTKVETAGES